MKRKVVFVLPSLAGGGAERVTLTLAHGLDRSKFDVTVVLFDGHGPLRSLLSNDVALVDLQRPRLRNAYGALIRRLRALRPDVVVSTFGYVNLALLFGRRFLPHDARLVFREANLPSLALANVRFGRALHFGYRNLYRKTDCLLCTSTRMADEFADIFAVPSDRLVILRNPVDQKAIRQSAAAPERIAGPGLRFVAAGRLVRQKGFDRLLDMVAHLPETTRLTILGDGPDRDALKRKAAELGMSNRVVFAGFKPSPWAQYAGADAVLIASRWEGMPNVGLEALAAGTPVLATPDAGAIAEIAATAPAGAVTIAEAGEEYIAAMNAVRPAPVGKPRPSQLPSEFLIDNVAARFEDLLRQ